MPADRSRPHRPPNDDPGFEVVDDAPPARPVRPVTARPVVARPAAPEPPDDSGYELVDERPPARKPKSKARVVEDDDTDSVPEVRTARARPADAGYGRRPGERVSETGEHFNDLQPGKRRLTKKERRQVREARERDEREAREQSAREWTFPAVVFAIGIGLTLAAAGVLAAKGGFAAVGVVVMLVLTAVECVLMIPLAIAALMAVGKLMGIEYGSATHAVRSLAAIIAVDTGVYWATIAGCEYLPCVAWPVGAVVGFLATYGLMMQFFELDAMEARVTVGAINFVTGVGTFVATVAIVALVAVLVSAARPNRNAGADGGPPAADVRDGGGNLPPDEDPDDR